MQVTDPATNSEKMHTPSYKLLVTTPMAAIMLSGKPNNQWSDLLESISPIYTSAAADTLGEVNEALSTISLILQGGDSLLSQYFKDDNLNFEGLIDISAKGADVWMCKLSDGEINKPDAIKLFKALQDGLIVAAGELREENEMIEHLIQTQDKIIEHISSLN